MVLDFFLEKLSGCFVHQACHKKGAFNWALAYILVVMMCHSEGECHRDYTMFINKTEILFHLLVRYSKSTKCQVISLLNFNTKRSDAKVALLRLYSTLQENANGKPATFVY
jgi:hypothetical protein